MHRSGDSVLPGGSQKNSEFVTRIMRQLWVFLAYVVAARMAIFLALPPGYATPIWPAAGIAIAATIAWGPSLTIAVFFGSIATNLRPDELLQNPLHQITLQTCLALGAALQTYLGSLIYHAFAKYKPELSNLQRLALETILLGPVTCLTAATIGIGTLTAFGAIEIHSSLTNWIWWWTGDAFGAGLLCPLLTRLQKSLVSRSARVRAMPYLLSAAGLGLLIVSGLAFYLNAHDKRNHLDLEQSVAEFHNHIQQDILQTGKHLGMLTDLSRAMDPQTVIERYPFIDTTQSLWISRSTLENKNDFEKHLSAAGIKPETWVEISRLTQQSWQNHEVQISPMMHLNGSQNAIILMKQVSQENSSSLHQGVLMAILRLDTLIDSARSLLGHANFKIIIGSTGSPANDVYQKSFGPQAEALKPYKTFSKTLHIGHAPMNLLVSFPAEAFNMERVADPILMTILCMLLSYSITILLISQLHTPAIVSPQEKVHDDEKNTQYEVLREADRHKGYLLANISYHIKAPLQRVLGLLDLILSSPVDNKQRSSIHTIINSCQVMGTMLDDIHTYTSMEAGPLALNNNEFLIDELLQELVSVYERTAEDCQNHLKSRFELPAGLYVEGDRQKLRRVLDHLLSDAIRHTQTGRITFQVSMSDKDIIFEIESIRSTQDAFYDNERQFGNAESYQPLEVFNLKICNRIVQAMGGIFSFKTPNPSSTLAKFILPLPTRILDSNQQPSQGLGHQDALVVDDNAVNLAVACGLLKKLGYSVDTANNGVDAVTKAKNKSYGLIFMDCQMPQMDGYETTRLIRAAYQPERGPYIVALTADAWDGLHERILQASMDSLIVKPISLDALIKTVGYAKKIPSKPPTAAHSIMDFKAFSLGLGDDPSLIQIAMSRFLEEIDGMMHRLSREVERSDASAIAKTSHTLKGMTALFAAHSLVEANLNLERAGRESRSHEFPALFQRVETLTNQLKTELKQRIKEERSQNMDVA